MPPEKQYLYIGIEHQDGFNFAYLEQGERRKTVAVVDAELFNLPGVEAAFKSFVFQIVREMVKEQTGQDIPDSDFEMHSSEPQGSH